ncbi:hypothetical protein NL64_06160 [Pseudomonas fluorescens]|uniref:hypothetical protein n=1 Tax=Pseudomonas fluorescens TaxID=294 RepID=UPI00054BB732|nr:hypothetical protein [Pseudomonas fluorescens]KII34844.1 hypothetical protein NL64_06160 [Pseudomonas fluorescens]
MVSGVAACVAQASAVPEVRKIFSGAAIARATSSTLAFKTVVPPAKVAAAKATVTGRAHVSFFARSALGTAVASIAGYAKADYFAAGEAHAYLTPVAVAYRKTRARPLAAWSYATGEGEGFVYQLAYGVPARAIAKGVGTTYHVGVGDTLASAAGVATATAFIGAKSSGLATAEVTGFVLRTAGAQGYGAATAALFGDAAITRAGVREFEAVGNTVCLATAKVSTTTVYQLQTLHCAAQASGYALQQFGGKGAATPKAVLVGDGLVIATGVTGAPGQTKATATGKCKLSANVRGSASASAKVRADARHTFGAQSAAMAKATAVQTLAEIRISAALIATGRAVDTEAVRNRVGGGSVLGTATASGFNLVNEVGPAPLSRTHYEGPFSRLVIISSEVRLLAA